MDLDPKVAKIGYKFEVDPKRSIIEIRADNTAGYDVMLEKIKDRIARACTRQVILEIHNLVQLIHSILGVFLQTTEQEVGRLDRRKKPKGPIVDLATVKQAHELRILKRKLSCAEDHRPWCWVAPDGSHRVLTVFQVTLWAQLIVCNSPQILFHSNLVFFPRLMGQPPTTIPL